mgnify:CR=1 FL=1
MIKKQHWMSLHNELEWFIGLNDQCFGFMFPEDLSRQLLIYEYYLLFVELIVNKNSVVHHIISQHMYIHHVVNFKYSYGIIIILIQTNKC